MYSKTALSMPSRLDLIHAVISIPGMIPKFSPALRAELLVRTCQQYICTSVGPHSGEIVLSVKERIWKKNYVCIDGLKLLIVLYLRTHEHICALTVSTIAWVGSAADPL